MAEHETSNDLIAGWIGGAAGILISNPLEVLKVRLQTTRSSPASRSPSPAPHFSPAPKSKPKPKHITPANLALQYSLPPTYHGTSGAFTPSVEWCKAHSSYPAERALVGDLARGGALDGLKGLWRQEGWRFLFAGAAGPILGLAFIDSLFFATYGRCMSGFRQDRQDPASLGAVFASGAAAGGFCALLQTPIEVVKCRAQAEPPNLLTGEKASSFEISKKIIQTQGLRGFYIGGLMTGMRDSASSGIFFASYTVLRRVFRGEPAFQREGLKSGKEEARGRSDWREVGRILLAGGCAGSMSAIIPYPLDIIKTRLQVSKVSSTASTPSSSKTSKKPKASTKIPTSPSTSLSQAPTIRSIARQIHSDGLSTPTNPNTLTSGPLYRIIARMFPLPANYTLRPSGERTNMTAVRWVKKVKGCKAFYRGIVPTVASSFAGSAVTIAAFEVVLEMLGARGGD